MNYSFDTDKITTKKLDRPKLVKGFNFSSQNSWGIPTNFTDIDNCLSNLYRTYPQFKIKIMSVNYKLKLEHNNLFKIPTKSNKLSQTTYNKIVLRNIEEFNKHLKKYNFGVNQNIEKQKIKLYYIMENYKNLSKTNKNN